MRRQLGENGPDFRCQAIGSPFGDADLSTCISDARQGMGEPYRGIGEKPAKIAGVVRALSQIKREIEVDGPTRTGEDGWGVWVQSRPVRGDQDISCEQCFVGLAEFFEPG